VNVARYCFVDLADANQVEEAVKLNGQDLKGSTITVQLAKDGPRTDATPAAKKSKVEKKEEPKKAIACMYSFM